MVVDRNIEIPVERISLPKGDHITLNGLSILYLYTKARACGGGVKKPF